MTTGINFWDYSIWDFVIVLAALSAALLIANLLIKLIKPLRHALIPAPLLGGFLLLALIGIYKAITGTDLFTPQIFEILTYHGLGIGFVALSLKQEKKQENNKEIQKGIFDASLITVSTYVLQGILGLAITVGLYFLINSWPASGLILPMGYGQGPGQAYSWGNLYSQYQSLDPAANLYSIFGPFENGTSFGLTVAAMGLVSSSVGGVIFLNVLRKKKNPKAMRRIEESVETETLETYVSENEIPAAESLDKSSVQVGLVFIFYAISFALIWGLSALCDLGGNFFVNTVKPLLWGFHFIFGMALATLGRLIINSMYKKGVIKRKYTNNYMLDRISGLAFDYMVVAAVAAINISVFSSIKFIVPLAALCVGGAVVTYVYCLHVCKKVYPSYWEESFLAMYGMLAGTTSTGIILLREIDPQFKTPACNNMVFQALWSLALGFPLMLAMGSAPQNWTNLIIWGAIFIVMFFVFYLLIRRDDVKNFRLKKLGGKNTSP